MMKNKLKRRLDKLENVTTVDASETLYLGFPPENNQYRIKKVYPPNPNAVEEVLTETEYKKFKKNLQGEIKEIRWVDDAGVVDNAGV